MCIRDRPAAQPAQPPAALQPLAGQTLGPLVANPPATAPTVQPAAQPDLALVPQPAGPPQPFVGGHHVLDVTADVLAAGAQIPAASRRVEF
eukprot:10937965-Alexandrium_andersonii.AAC.1